MMIQRRLPCIFVYKRAEENLRMVPLTGKARAVSPVALLFPLTTFAAKAKLDAWERTSWQLLQKVSMVVSISLPIRYRLLLHLKQNQGGNQNKSYKGKPA